MAKYNIREKKDKSPMYQMLVKPALMDKLKAEILRVIVKEKKYRDRDYSAKQLAIDLGTNTRYGSAVVNVKFGMNYTTFVNKYRIKEAMKLLADPHYGSLNMQEVSDMVGFANRQSFYAAFYRLQDTTPREYRMSHMPKVNKFKGE